MWEKKEEDDIDDIHSSRNTAGPHRAFAKITKGALPLEQTQAVRGHMT
jgi:hypothetical protein